MVCRKRLGLLERHMAFVLDVNSRKHLGNSRLSSSEPPEAFNHLVDEFVTALSAAPAAV